MPIRLAAVLVFLLLAGCATTGSGTGELTEAAPVPADEAEPVFSSAATIDEHLYVPPPERAPASGDPSHVHPNVWERLTHDFVLPECSEHQLLQVRIPEVFRNNLPNLLLHRLWRCRWITPITV